MFFFSFPRSVVLTVHGMDDSCTYSPGVLGAEHFTLPSGLFFRFLMYRFLQRGGMVRGFGSKPMMGRCV